MKNKLRIFFAAIAFLAISQTSLAHALWISSAPVGKLGKPHTVDIYYGEYKFKEIDSIEKWYSDVSQFKLWLVSPSGQKEALSLTNEKDHFHATFTPKEKGIYKLQVEHDAKELSGTVKYHFSSNALVAVDEKNALPTSLSDHLSIYAQPKIYQKSKPVTFKVYQNGQAYKDAPVEFSSPEGWSITLKTNEAGEVTFTPLWKGLYLVETTSYEDISGDWYGLPFTNLWSSTTNFIYVQ